MFKNTPNTTRRTFVKGVGAVAATALFAGKNQLLAHASTSQEGVQHATPGNGINVLLVHGAFVDASSWSLVIPLLQASGYHVLAVQNPTTSLADDIDVTSQALATLSGPTILVGHSYGGAVITNIGPAASNVRALVYIAAFAPDQGETVFQATENFAQAPGPGHILPSYRSGFLWVDPAFFPTDFMQDVNQIQANALTAVQKPIAQACVGAVTGVPAWKSIPSWYLVSAHDRMINPDAEHFMAQRMNATTQVIQSSHASPVSHPYEVYQPILAATRRIQG